MTLKTLVHLYLAENCGKTAATLAYVRSGCKPFIEVAGAKEVGDLDWNDLPAEVRSVPHKRRNPTRF